MKARTFARRIAHSEGVKPVSNKDLEFLIWERTGYPGFWETSDPIKEFEEQLRQAFQDIKSGKSKQWESPEQAHAA